VRRAGQARRRDRAEGPIVAALRAVGATVIPISGKGAPDLFVCFRGQMWGAEVKTGKGKLTPAQQESGAGQLWPVWTTPEQALSAIGATKGSI
jgi:hypothetical protein